MQTIRIRSIGMMLVALMVIPAFIAAQQSNVTSETVGQVLALQNQMPEEGSETYELLRQVVKLDMKNVTLEEALTVIAEQANLKLMYRKALLPEGKNVSYQNDSKTVYDALWEILNGTGIQFAISQNRQLVLLKMHDVERILDQKVQETIRGRVTDAETGETMPGVNILIEGSTSGTATDINGEYSLEVPGPETVLIFSYIGYRTQRITIGDRQVINVSLEVDVGGMDEVVVVGYGTQRAANVTSSISSRDIEDVESSDVSIFQSLHGSIPGLNVGQVNQAGQDPSISIRGRVTLSGETNPLIVVDGVIYRGNIIDLNPNDIASVDVLKDASATAVYGSQASNGVIILTTSKSSETIGKPEINFSSQYSLQEPWRELRPQNPIEFMEKIEHSDLEAARTEESGYTERDPSWSETANFKTNHEVQAFAANLPFNWYDYLTSDQPYTMTHNMSIGNRVDNSSYYSSVGYTEQQGHMKDEGYKRINARINLNSDVTDWFEVNIQSYMTVSEYDDEVISLSERYAEPFSNPYVINNGEETDELVLRHFGQGVNPMIMETADIERKRTLLNGNISFIIDLPIRGLAYTGNLANSFTNSSNYNFEPYGSEFQGSGSKREDKRWDLVSDHILYYDRSFNDIHFLDVTLLYGIEQRKSNFTNASGSNFVSDVLGFNRLQAAQNDLQSVSSGGWEEASLYNMGRLHYVLKDKYLLTATIRRDGFSGFSENYKFGYFPSLSLGWIITEEPFFNNPDWLNSLKLRGSYGVTGNRTISRYQTLAQVSGTQGYVTADGSSISTQKINQLSSPNLKWEKTTGFDVGIDFSLIEGRINGVIDYYSHSTTDLLYDVDIPSMTGYNSFSDNLGEIHNRGFEVELSSVNIHVGDFMWQTDFYFSANRDKIKTLLGFDNDGDGNEDDLISEGLFIGENLNAIYDYKINGLWQVDDDIPSGYEFGSYKVMDINNDGTINQDDKTIIGHRDPAYRFSINNMINYQNWTLSFFINSIQGGSDRYLSNDDLYGLGIFNTEVHFNRAFPAGLDYWTPSNTDAKYQRPGITGASGIRGNRYTSRSFIRLQNVRLSYNFSGVDRYGFRNVNLFISSKNLATWTNWPGWDPETGTKISQSGRPVMRSFNLGMNITL